MNARDYAIRAHGDQRYGAMPYVVHLDAVVAVLEEFELATPKMRDAGYLHDVLEDCGVRYDELALEFPEAAPLVEKVTGRGPNRKARNADIRRKIEDDTDAQNLKGADRLANKRAAKQSDPAKWAMYCKESEAFLESIPLADPILRAALRVLAAS